MDTIHDFYVNQKVVPTCEKLLIAMKQKINFPWGALSLRWILREWGSDGKNAVLIGDC